VSAFTPNWFTVTMGTGVLALTLNQFPIPLPGLHSIALFTLFSLIFAARFLLFFDEARGVFAHPVISMFFGAIPMGLATIIIGFLAFGEPLFGAIAVSFAHDLWWLDVLLSVVSGLLIPYLMVTRQEHRLETMTAVWLLPVVAAEVAAASGALLATHLSAQDAFAIVILSYVLWAYSVPLAMSILVLLFLRLVLHKLPEREMGVSAWLALGPIGTGSLGLLLLGDGAPAIFAAHGIGDVAYGVGLIGGLMLWGYGVWWLLLALLKTIRYIREGLPFNLGWWGFTFPLGVYTLATLALARLTQLAAFTVIGGVLALCLAVLWVIVASGTVRGAWHGSLFHTPRRVAELDCDV
jgi:C4-dicarboxylate transporter/malic acid transport protein